VSGSTHIRHTSSLTRHDFLVSLVGNGEGGGVPACSRVYMNSGAGVVTLGAPTPGLQARQVARSVELFRSHPDLVALRQAR
jgi:hypothetical protein